VWKCNKIGSYHNKGGFVIMVTTTVKKWGNSLAIRIPLKLSKQVNLNVGTEISLAISENNKIILKPLTPAPDDQAVLRAHFLKLRNQCKPGMENHEEMFADPMGDEII
jgi:antitoxin component of MazEF toxin-antitoxin module